MGFCKEQDTSTSALWKDTVALEECPPPPLLHFIDLHTEVQGDIMRTEHQNVVVHQVSHEDGIYFWICVNGCVPRLRNCPASCLSPSYVTKHGISQHHHPP